MQIYPVIQAVNALTSIALIVVGSLWLKHRLRSLCGC